MSSKQWLSGDIADSSGPIFIEPMSNCICTHSYVSLPIARGGLSKDITYLKPWTTSHYIHVYLDVGIFH